MAATDILGLSSWRQLPSTSYVRALLTKGQDIIFTYNKHDPDLLLDQLLQDKKRCLQRRRLAALTLLHISEISPGAQVNFRSQRTGVCPHMILTILFLAQARWTSKNPSEAVYFCSTELWLSLWRILELWMLGILLVALLSSEQYHLRCDLEVLGDQHDS